MTRPCSAPTAALRALEEILLQDLGSSVLPDLLDTMKSVRAGSILLSMVRICAGSVESSTRSSGYRRLSPEGLGKHLWPEARSAHAEQQDMREALPAGCPRPSFRAGPMRLRCSSTMPSQPSHLASSVPVQRRASPAQSRRTLPVAPPRFERGRDRLLELGRELGRLAVELVAEESRRACGHRPSSLSKASAKSCTPSSTSFAVTSSIEMPDRSKRRHRLLGLVDILLKARPHLPMIAEGIHRRRRHGVDRVGGDQLLDIEHVAVGLVLRAGACP